MIVDHQANTVLTIVQSYFKENIGIDPETYLITIDGMKTNTKLTDDYNEVVMKLYVDSGKVDKKSLETIKALME